VEDFAAAERASSGPPPVSVHFVNNVLAAAASYIEDDPDEVRDVLAQLDGAEDASVEDLLRGALRMLAVSRV
jgi:hypothetical protein